MTIKHVCAVYDQAVEAFSNPIFVRAIGEATRSFVDEVNNKESVFNHHPQDYELWYIGQYDDVVGVILSNKDDFADRRRLLRAIDVVQGE